VRRGTTHESGGVRRTTGHELLRLSIATATDWREHADDCRHGIPRTRCHLLLQITSKHLLPSQQRYVRVWTLGHRVSLSSLEIFGVECNLDWACKLLLHSIQWRLVGRTHHSPFEPPPRANALRYFLIQSACLHLRSAA
jgi:hypothetical protein